MIRTSVMPMKPAVAMEDLCSESASRKRDRSSSPVTDKQPPCAKRPFFRRDSDCSEDSTTEDFIPVEEESPSSQILVRQDMLARIQERLDPNEPRRICLAKKLEALLFHNAPTFEIYADVDTLDSRIRLAAIALVSRQRLKKAQEKKDRHQALIKALGDDKYQEVCDAVTAVQDLRLRGAACCRCTTTCCQKKLTPIPGQRVMPTAVRNLFFETKLIDAAENTPLDKVSSLDWDAMVSQARENMSAFQEWSGLTTKASFGKVDSE